jgi:hypothetical protein
MGGLKDTIRETNVKKWKTKWEAIEYPPELNDWMAVMEFGAKKHGANNWLEKNGSKSSHNDMHASMSRHLEESWEGGLHDKDTGLHPLLHLASRALMMYVRNKRNIVHHDDITSQGK